MSNELVNGSTSNGESAGHLTGVAGVSARAGNLLGKASAIAPMTSEIVVKSNERLQQQLWGEMTPAELFGILRMAINGNLIYQERLFQKMCDEWPRLQKNLLTLKRDLSNIPWNIQPFSDKGGTPSSSADDKASLVERAIFGMKPDPTRRQREFYGMIKDLTNAISHGFSINEINWMVVDGEIVPQCTFKLPARFYGYPLQQDSEDRLMLSPTGHLALNIESLKDFSEFPNKFLIAIYESYDNHPTVAAMLRSLTGWWLASKYGLKWFMTFAQMFGTPMRVAEYEGTDTTTANTLAQMMEDMASTGWAVFPVGAKVQLIEAKANNGSTIPQAVLLQMADDMSDIVILGQTLTSGSGRSGGNRALGEVHADTERKLLNGAAGFVADVINTQLIPAIIRLNYGEESELPYIEGAIEEPQDEVALVNRDLVLFGEMGLPVAKDFLYERHAVPEPDENAELFIPPSIGQDPVFPEKSLVDPMGNPVDPKTGLNVANPNGKPPAAPLPLKPGAVGEMKGGQEAVNAAQATRDFMPTHKMSHAARVGLDQRKENGMGGSLMTVARGRSIAAGTPMSASMVKRMLLWFDKHPGTVKPGEPGYAEYMMHGGEEGRAWAESIDKTAYTSTANG